MTRLWHEFCYYTAALVLFVGGSLLWATGFMVVLELVKMVMP